jgi:hypothetical protein
LPVTLDLASDWTTLLSLIKTAGKYVALDLSACTMTGTEFNPGAANTGESKIVSLVLPNVATSIKNGSFVVSTHYATFRYFTALKSISGSSIISIGDYAFYNCDSLTTMTFPKATSIGDYAFYRTALTTADFPLATSIGDYAFGDCDSLTTMTSPKATSIGNYAFYRTALTTADFPLATSIGYGAFYSTNLTSVSFPEATSISSSTFCNCASLTTVNIPKAASIGSYAFDSCTKLTTVNIPKAASIDSYAFSNTGGLALTITLGSAAPTLGGRMFSGVSISKTVTVKVPAGATGYGKVPETYSGSDTTECWGNGFRGGGWNGSAFTDSVIHINSYITLKIEYK